MYKTRRSGIIRDLPEFSSRNLIVFSITAVALFVLMFVIDNFNTEHRLRPAYSADTHSFYIGQELEGTNPKTLSVDTNWIFIPNVTPDDVASGLLNSSAWKDTMPYAEGVSITNSFGGWNDYEDSAVWHNRPEDLVYNTYFIDDLVKLSACYYTSFECERSVRDINFSFHSINGIARIYCNGKYAGSIGDRPSSPFNSNVFSDYVTLIPDNGHIDLAIVVSCNDRIPNPGILSSPMLSNSHMMDVDIAIKAGHFSIVIILVLTAFMIGSYIILSNTEINKSYVVFMVSFFALALYYLFDGRFISVNSYIRANTKFSMAILSTLCAYAVNTYIFRNSHANRKYSILKYDHILIGITGIALLLFYAIVDVLGYKTLPLFCSISFCLAALYLAIIKDLIFYRKELGGQPMVALYYCYFIFIMLLSILMNSNRTYFLPTYSIILSVIIIICLIGFAVTMNRTRRRIIRDSTILKRQVREKTLYISEINRDLVESNKQLKEGETARKHVLSNVSHDLRTPITAIRGYAELMLTSKSMTKEQTESYLNNIIRRSEQMERIVSDIVELTRMEASDAEFNFTDVSMSEMLDELVTMYSLDLNGTQKHISLDLPDSDLLIVKADPKKFSRVFENLISNAINYTNSEAEIEVKAWRTGQGLPVIEQKVHITVKDNGIGIPPDEIGKIFDRFYRAKNSGVNIKGTGLGLAIVKLICDKHNASITVNSAIGSGTTFEIVIGATY